MSERQGKHFEARVSVMIGAGVFVILESTVEGMIPFRTMNDYFVFDPNTLTAKGSRSGRVFKIGDKLEVVIARADLIRRQVDFALPEDWTYLQKKAKREQEGNGNGSGGSALPRKQRGKFPGSTKPGRKGQVKTGFRDEPKKGTKGKSKKKKGKHKK